MLRLMLQEEQQTEADLADLAESVQLHHQLRILGAALQTAQLDPAQFGLNAAVRLCMILITMAGACLSCACLLSLKALQPAWLHGCCHCLWQC